MNQDKIEPQSHDQSINLKPQNEENVSSSAQVVEQSAFGTSGTTQQRAAIKSRGGFRRSKRFYNGGII